MASGHVNRATGRTHGRTDQSAYVKKVLANSEPSTHGAEQTATRDMPPMAGLTPMYGPAVRSKKISTS